MFQVIECIWTEHDHLVIGVAAGIWIIGSLAFFLALERAQECQQQRRAVWLLIEAIAGGLGVWATHFVAMLAYRGRLPIGYASAPTIISAAIAVAGCWIALMVLGTFSLSRCVVAGMTLTAAVGVVHFTGMAGIQVQANIQYDWTTVGVSAAVAMALFTLAFFAFSRMPRFWHILGAATASIVGVCALHFTGMSATTLIFDPTLPSVEVGSSRAWLIGATAGSTLIVILFTGFATLIDRYLTDLKGFADATLEGIVIMREGRVVEANHRFAEWVGVSVEDLFNLDPDRLMVAEDGCPVSELRESPVEAVLRGQGSNRVFEVGVHEIEYRGRPSKVLAVRDLTHAKAAQRQIEHIARHDSLTGLPNRTLLSERLDHAIACL
ncbi:PAS domain S-box-containing protein [Sphingobium sp. B11D3B]|uniref:MHYT domain-containing protein n=1 Tax=Sphingobium sp. B11D3B TaxID=2940575 RepID=UPI0022280B4F|nr:MHYT domain-containing protein [Sphingobium sp. B11D3B]MCW2389223.1 PAS domain S-box-containing protein [Sphingobium sp. B11D3B]